MKFKIGSKVEVFSTKEVPSGSWCPAEIVYGYGHTYSIRYDGCAVTTENAAVERVPSNAIRPCPPQKSVFESWVPGDVVEVLDNFSWKMAAVSKVLGKKYILARLLGSSREMKVSKFDVRIRQSWQDHKWVIIGKGSGNSEDRKHDEKLIPKYNRRSRVKNMDRSSVKTKIKFQESPFVSSHTLKRESSPYTVAAKKYRAIEKDRRCYRLVAAIPSEFLEQVDDVPSPGQMLHEKHINASFNKRTNAFCEMDAERRKETGAVGCSLAIDLDSNDADTVTCSVGSCSIASNNSYRISHHFPAGPIEEIDGNFSDAESFCHWGYEEGNCLLPTKEELEAEIHRLELHAYRCTIEALHSSGPLSWEQEALVTNLRLSLHISNDEHLMELRNLGSSVTSIVIS